MNGAEKIHHHTHHAREQMIPKTSIKQARTHTPHMFGSNNVLLLESREQHALHCTSSTAPSLAASLSLLRHVKAPPLLLFLLYWPGFSKQQQFSLHKHSVRVCMCLSVRVFAHHFRTFATVRPRCTAVGGICGAIYFTPAFFNPYGDSTKHHSSLPRYDNTQNETKMCNDKG